MKFLIVDDEPHCRATIRSLLSARRGGDTLLESADGDDALKQIATEAPDVVFLDVQMPLLTGLEVAASIPPGMNPLIVFVTAFDEHAIRAFELHAIDYLLKPFSDDRFNNCIENVLLRIHGSIGSRDPGSVILKVGADTVFCRCGDIRWIEADGDYLRIHAKARALLVRDTIRSMQERLQGRGFIRIHKSILVNRARIRRMTPIHSGDYTLELDEGTILRASRSYRDEFRGLLG